MFFSENLETCTIGLVSFCEGGVGVSERDAENAFFILVGGDGTHRPHPGLWPHSPQVAPARPDRLHITGSRADHAKTRAGKYQGRPRKARHTRPDAGHASPVCTRYQTDRAGQIVTVQAVGGREACPKLSKIGHISAAQKSKFFRLLFCKKALTL